MREGDRRAAQRDRRGLGLPHRFRAEALVDRKPREGLRAREIEQRLGLGEILRRNPLDLHRDALVHAG